MGNELSSQVEGDVAAAKADVDRFRPGFQDDSVELAPPSKMMGTSYRQVQQLSGVRGTSPSSPIEVDRFRQTYSESDLIRDIKREEVRRTIQLVPQKAILDREFIEYPRFTLLSRDKEQHFRVHDVREAHQFAPPITQQEKELVEKASAEGQRDNLCHTSRQETIIEQLGRITFLEDKMEVLQKETQNQIFHLKYKHQQALNYVDDYNHLRAQISKQEVRQTSHISNTLSCLQNNPFPPVAYHTRVSSLEDEAKMKDSARIEEEIAQREEEAAESRIEIEELQDQIAYWKEKAMVEENCVSIITGLRMRTQVLMHDNSELKRQLFDSDDVFNTIREVTDGVQSTAFQQKILDEADNLLRDFQDVQLANEFKGRKNTTSQKKTPSYTASSLATTFKQQQIRGSK